MDFAFSDGVALGGECRRVALEEVEGAISRLACFHEDPDIAIHEVRKHNKRIRSVLLLAGSALDPDDLARTNRLVRDAARLFSGARDAFVLQDTCDKLAARFPGDAGDVLQQVRDTFAERHAACLLDAELPGKISRAGDDFREAGQSIGQWDWEQVTREAIFRAILSHSLRGLSDFEKARRSRDPEDCHDWRKRTKALSYHLTLLAPLDAEGKEGVEKGALDAGELASSLGEHHDLAVFEEAVGEGMDQGVFPGAARLLPALAAKRREELEEEMFARGEVLYRDFLPSLRRFLHCLLAGVIMFCAGGCESYLSPDGGVPVKGSERSSSSASGEEFRAGISSREAEWIVDYHNEKRKEAGTRPLRWSPELARYAQERAETIAKTGQMTHLPARQNRYGENLAQGGRGGGDSGFTVRHACESWYAEKAKMPTDARVLNSALFQRGVGHYTQMIWHESTHVGAGKAHFHKDGMAMTVVVCCYDPRGNLIGGTIYGENAGR